MNYLAIVVAAVSSFLIGGLWYSNALFGAAWNKENGSPPPPGHPARSLESVLFFRWWRQQHSPRCLARLRRSRRSVAQGALVGFGIVAASFGINYQFAQRSSSFGSSMAVTTWFSS